MDWLSAGLSHEQIKQLSFEQITSSYLEYYTTGRGHTARAKRIDLQHFTKFLMRLKGLSKPDKLRLADWDSAAVERFIEQRLEYGEAPATVSRRLATLKHMGRTFAERVAGFINPARDIRPPRIALGKPKAIAPSELEDIRQRKQTPGNNSFNKLRNEVIFELLLDTGLRAEEVRLLRRGQLDESLEWIKNVRTKGRRYRNVYITSKMQPRLQEYLEQRSKKLQASFTAMTKADDAALPLFISTYNASPADPESFLMGAKSIWRAINSFSAQTKLHPHLLRHSFAIDLLDSSNDVRLVSQALGHSDVRITMRYTERTEEALAEALEKSRNKK